MPFRSIGKQPFWAKFWPGSLLDANFCQLSAPRPAIEFLFWDHWETALLGQIPAGSLWEAAFCHFKALGPAIEFLFWDHRETALLGQILAGSFRKQIFAISRPFGRLLNFSSGTNGKRPF
jgi:hypothetical protein